MDHMGLAQEERIRGGVLRLARPEEQKYTAEDTREKRENFGNLLLRSRGYGDLMAAPAAI